MYHSDPSIDLNDLDWSHQIINTLQYSVNHQIFFQLLKSLAFADFHYLPSDNNITRWTKAYQNLSGISL
jgi:hypothetical protein